MNFVFTGRSFTYGVGTLGQLGGECTILIPKRQLQQVMVQNSCERVADLPRHLLPADDSLRRRHRG